MIKAHARLYRASLRLALRPVIVLFGVLAVLVVVAVSLSSRDYANDQLQVVSNAGVSTCDELVERGLDEAACVQVQQSQEESVQWLQELAADIGPSAATLATDSGAVAFVLGHALSAVGMVFAGLITAVSYSIEQAKGVARIRERLRTPFAVNVSRISATLTIWLAWLAVSIIAVVTLDGLSPRELLAEYAPLSTLASTSALLVRFGAGIVGAAIIATLTLAGRPWIRARPAAVALGALAALSIASALAAALPPPLTPFGAQLGLQQLGENSAFIDHLPFVELEEASTLVAGTALAGWAMVAGTALLFTCRKPV